MAKYVVTIENGEIKKELFFKGETFTYSMIPTETGSKGNAKCFVAQLEDKYGDNVDYLLDAADQIDFGDEDDIQEAISVLTGIE